MSSRYKTPVIKPTPLPLSAARTTRRRPRSIVQRVRLEHLATELLRMAGALRPPVQIEAIWENPPQNLWLKPSGETVPLPQLSQTSDDPYWPRWLTALKVAAVAGGTVWPPKVRLMGEKPFTEKDAEIFARALLIPTPLLSNLSERQKTPGMIHTIFQAPLAEVKIRLEGLGLH